MDAILETLKQEKAIQNVEYVQRLQEAGFPVPAVGYPRITQEAIVQYLVSVAYKMWGKRAEQVPAWANSRYPEVSCPIKFFPTEIWGHVHWLEHDISSFQSTPPKHILDSIVKAKPDFDRLKIVTVHTEERVRVSMPDPLVIGIKNGISDRFLIDWWDTDIDPSEIEIS